jgi:hypothetical protein
MSLLPSVVASTSAFQLVGVGSLLVLDRESFATIKSLSIEASLHDLADC